MAIDSPTGGKFFSLTKSTLFLSASYFTLASQPYLTSMHACVKTHAAIKGEISFPAYSYISWEEQLRYTPQILLRTVHGVS